jgi:hypothetical protein
MRRVPTPNALDERFFVVEYFSRYATFIFRVFVLGLVVSLPPIPPKLT